MSQYNLDSLSAYTKVDRQKERLISEIISKTVFHSTPKYDVITPRELFYEDQLECDNDVAFKIRPVKTCPKCGEKYPEYENFCFECDVKLKYIKKNDVGNIKIRHDFACNQQNISNDFNEILSGENLLKINSFKFSQKDLRRIIKNIKSEAIRNLDTAIRENEIDLDELDILDKVILFVKSFVDVEYKSYGAELGYYSFNKIHVDDRQLDSLQITTMLHELTHFLNKEILTHILCSLLGLSKSREIESIITFILSYSKENCLIDEYAAHTVEGRFTLFGYQDYSSFLDIQKEIDMSDEEIEMLKTIGNSLANVNRDIIESFIDDELLSQIKVQFKKDVLDEPNYAQLRLENCTLLNNEGFLRAIQFILLDGFATASQNIEKLISINEMWQVKI